MKRIDGNWKSEMIDSQRSAVSLQPQAESRTLMAVFFAFAVFLFAALPAWADTWATKAPMGDEPGRAYCRSGK